jgi:hypothetical protein
LKSAEHPYSQSLKKKKKPLKILKIYNL